MYIVVYSVDDFSTDRARFSHLVSTLASPLISAWTHWYILWPPRKIFPPPLSWTFSNSSRIFCGQRNKIGIFPRFSFHFFTSSLSLFPLFSFPSILLSDFIPVFQKNPPPGGGFMPEYISLP